jgi:hypothetical protein
LWCKDSAVFFNLELISFLINSSFFLSSYRTMTWATSYRTMTRATRWVFYEKQKTLTQTGASGLSSTYLAESELLITLYFLLCKFQVFESWISSLSLLSRPCPCLWILRLIIIRIAVFHDLSWFDIHICNYLSLSKDRKMSLWPWHFTIDIENKHSYNLND